MNMKFIYFEMIRNVKYTVEYYNNIEEVIVHSM